MRAIPFMFLLLSSKSIRLGSTIKKVLILWYVLVFLIVFFDFGNLIWPSCVFCYHFSCSSNLTVGKFSIRIVVKECIPFHDLINGIHNLFIHP